MHFAVDVIVNTLPTALQRTIFVVVQLIVLAVLAILLVKGVQLTALNWTQLSPAMQIPISFPYAAIPTASALMILVALRRLCRDVRRATPFLPE
jgi:TRAP-type C4-dicarboxylate transport system permease small subunit